MHHRFVHHWIRLGGIVLNVEMAVEKPAQMPVKRSKGKLSGAAARSFAKHWQLYLIVTPPLLFFFIFKYYPMLNAVLAFKDYNVIKGIWGSPWVGLEELQAVLR